MEHHDQPNANTPTPNPVNDQPANLGFSTEAEPSWTISGIALDHIHQTAKWAGFLAVIGLIALGLTALAFCVALLSIGTISQFGSSNELGTAAIFPVIIGLLILLFYGIPIWWLYRFSTRVKDAVRLRDTSALESAFNFLRKHYRFIGILTIILLSLYAISIAFAVMGGFFALLAGS